MEPGNMGKRIGLMIAVSALAVVVAGCGPRGREPLVEPAEKRVSPSGPSKGETVSAPERPTEPATTKRDAQQQGVPGTSTGPNPSQGEDTQAKPKVAPQSPAGQDEPARTDDELPEKPSTVAEEKPIDLGEPLVDDLKSLRKLDPDRPVWIDGKGKRVVMLGQVCQRSGPLEMFVCLKNTKEYESVIAVDVKAAVVHAGLVALGAEPGHPVKFAPEYVPASGTEIEVTVAWKDDSGKTQLSRGQDWILDTGTNKAMAYPWVFAGSGFWEDPQTGKRHYQAEGGDFICVSNFSSAMLDLPIKSSDANAELMFQPFTERIPPLGTPITLVLSPKLKGKDDRPKKPSDGDPASSKDGK